MPPPQPRRLLFLSAAFLSTLAIASLDLSSRVRSACRNAERLERLARRPVERESALEKAFLDGVADLDRRRPSPSEREAGVEILRKRWEEDRLRSPWAEAYHAWSDVHALYAPPENRWTRRARLMAPAARQRWREEWTARRLPFPESLLGLEPGEEEGVRLLCTFTDRREASQVLDMLEALEIPCRLADAGGTLRLFAPEDRFWDAHKALLPLVGGDENL